MVKNALTRNFNYDLDQRSPSMGELGRVEKRLEDGSIVVSYEPVDLAAIQASFGPADAWSLSALRDAGVNPNFPIHTTAPTRMESYGALKQFVERGEAILKDFVNESSVEPSVESSVESSKIE